MSNQLTPKQEKFAQVYVECGNASEAYRQAYNAENMQDDSNPNNEDINNNSYYILSIVLR